MKAKAGAQHKVIDDANLGEGAGTLLFHSAVGSFVACTVPVPGVGTYRVKVRVKTGPKRGKFQLAIGVGEAGPGAG